MNNIDKLIQADGIKITLDNLFYQLNNRPHGREVTIESDITKYKSRYYELTGHHYVYQEARREAA